MKLKERTPKLPEKAKPTTIESVKFRDGMVVTADDLDAAMRYPASLLRTVLRSYFGCGVVCGLDLRVKQAPGKEPNWVVCVERGVAIDCEGYPVELCAPVELDLSPDACDCDPPPEEVCIAVRRITSDEAPQDACSCDVDGPQFDCRRTRDHVLVKAFNKVDFDDLPGTVCRRPEGDEGSSGDKAQNGKLGEGKQKQNGNSGESEQNWADVLCASTRSCPACACGGCWVLLGCVALDEEEGITGDPDTGDRQWVKPIEALCSTVVGHVVQLEEKVSELSECCSTVTDQLKDLEGKVSELSKPPTGQGQPTPL
jgi:hypothetical protein